ncbi:MAG: hypothetical protein ACK559_34350, partial [bacterium]
MLLGGGRAHLLQPVHELVQGQPQHLAQAGPRVGRDVVPDDVRHLGPVALADARIAEAGHHANVLRELVDGGDGEGADLERRRQLVRVCVLQVHLGVLGLPVQGRLLELRLEELLELDHLAGELGDVAADLEG